MRIFRLVRWLAELVATIVFAILLFPSGKVGWVYINRWPGE